MTVNYMQELMLYESDEEKLASSLMDWLVMIISRWEINLTKLSENSDTLLVWVTLEINIMIKDRL